MHAKELVERYPVTSLQTDALDAARLIAESRLPGLIVTDEDGAPYAVLPSSQVVRFLVPTYVQDDPSLAAVINEPAADRIAGKLSGRTVREMLPERPTELATVRCDDTVLEVAAVMARVRSPLVAVVDENGIVGAITASRLLEVALLQR